MAERAMVTPGQSFFSPGYVSKNRVLADSARYISQTAGNEFVEGFPVCMDGAGTDQGKLKSVTDAATDKFYGMAGQHINLARGSVSLGEQKNVQMLTELQGIFTVRRTVVIDSAGAEQTISPFTGFAGANGFPMETDLGKTVDAIEVTSEAVLGSTSILKWGVGGGSDTGFADVAEIVEVRGTGTAMEEVDLRLPGVLAVRGTSV